MSDHLQYLTGFGKLTGFPPFLLTQQGTAEPVSCVPCSGTPARRALHSLLLFIPFCLLRSKMRAVFCVALCLLAAFHALLAAASCSVPPTAAWVVCNDAGSCTAVCSNGFSFGYGAFESPAICPFLDANATSNTGAWEVSRPCLLQASLSSHCSTFLLFGEKVVNCQNLWRCTLFDCASTALNLFTMPAFESDVEVIVLGSSTFRGNVFDHLMTYPLLNSISIVECGLGRLDPPPGGVQLPSLRTFRATLNSITVVASDFFRHPAFQGLTKIDLSSNPLTSLPDGIFDTLGQVCCAFVVSRLPILIHFAPAATRFETGRPGLAGPTCFGSFSAHPSP